MTISTNLPPQNPEKPQTVLLPPSFHQTQKPRAKRSPCLQPSHWTVECSSADSRNFVLQPIHRLKGLFEDDHKDKYVDTEDERKIKIITHRLEKIGVSTFKDSDITYALNSTYASGDVDKAYELISLLEESEGGRIRPFDPSVKLLGAVNRESVTCYLDALLFAMFARLGSFEAMLYTQTEDKSRKRLMTLLRLWVNMLRAGKLITVDITKQIQLQLSNCGWKEAAELCQQDASEAFTFITSTLLLPLLTLKMDIYHTGREDAKDDHKFINERLLELAVPEEPEDGSVIITLEDCLEMYFNNRIEVKRHLDLLERKNTLSSVLSRADSNKAQTSHVEIAELNSSQPSSPIMPRRASPSPTTPVRPAFTRPRGTSIIQEHYIDEKRGFSPMSDDGYNARLKKEVMMPAWQFYSLIPWYTDNTPRSDAQVAAHFSRERPILGMCLKRYSFLPNGTAVKRKTHIDVPLEIGLPHFISDDEMADDGPAFGNFKMSLQSVVCHQGLSVDSGHYISLVRCPDPQGEDRWMRFDDLAQERVTYTNVEEFLRQESPYLLFYQIVPIGDAPAPDNDRNPLFTGPPSYAESNKSTTSRKAFMADDSQGSTKTSLETNMNSSQQKPSLDISRPSLETSISSEESRRGRLSMASHRESSIQSADIHRLAVPSNNGEGLRSSPSNSKSRPTSQSRENRLSASLSRMASKMSRDRSIDHPGNAVQPQNLKHTTVVDDAKGASSTALLKENDGSKSKHPAIIDVVNEASHKARFGKDHSDKHHSKQKEHSLLTRAKGREAKPDRECNVM